MMANAPSCCPANCRPKFTRRPGIGTHSIQAELLEGEMAGLNAAAKAGFGQGAARKLSQQVAGLKAGEPLRNHRAVYVAGTKKGFISFDEDVTIKDLKDAIAEGYDSMELLKGTAPEMGLARAV
jgi:sarcosine oxidase subunit alpha